MSEEALRKEIKDLQTELKRVKEQHLWEVLALVNAAGGKVEFNADYMAAVKNLILERRPNRLGGITFKVGRN